MTRRTKVAAHPRTWSEDGRTFEGITVRRGAVFVFVPFEEITRISDAMIDHLEEHLAQHPPAPEDTP